MTRVDEQELVEQWNRYHPVGTLVRYWRMDRRGEPSGTGKTRSRAWLLGGHSAVVLIEGTSGGIALSHVDVVSIGGEDG